MGSVCHRGTQTIVGKLPHDFVQDSHGVIQIWSVSQAGLSFLTNHPDNLSEDLFLNIWMLKVEGKYWISNKLRIVNLHCERDL